MTARPVPPAGAMLLTLGAVVALAVHLVAPPHPHRGDQLPGLTYEPKRAAPRMPIDLIVTSVQDGGPADKVDIAPGDVIDRIDGNPIASDAAVGRAVRGDAGKAIILHLRHEGESRYKSLPPARAREPHVAEDTRRRG